MRERERAEAEEKKRRPHGSHPPPGDDPAAGFFFCSPTLSNAGARRRPWPFPPLAADVKASEAGVAAFLDELGCDAS